MLNQKYETITYEKMRKKFSKEPYPSCLKFQIFLWFTAWSWSWESVNFYE